MKSAQTNRQNDAQSIRVLLTRLIRESSKSREQIADELSAKVGSTVTRRALDSYTSAAEQQNRWPAQYDIAMCEVLDDWSLLKQRVELAGFRMIGCDEQRILKIGRAYIAKLRAEKTLAEVEL